MNYYDSIKNQLVNNEITKKVKTYSINKSDLTTYYNVGKLLSEAGKHYGEGIIKEYSKRLTEDLGKGYTISSLKRFRKFYNVIQKGATLSHQLTWSHYQELLPINNINMINYYIYICKINNLSIRQLREHIKSNEYERLPKSTINKMINNEKTDVKDMIKNPIIIKSDKEVISEKILQRIILEDIPSFMNELGEGFSFINNEYPIKIGNRYNYIDLLLYNIKYNCYVVIDLKLTELKKDHIGQIQVYMNFIDNNLRTINQDKTIGIIICKKDNKFIMKYCSDNRVLSREYIIQ